MEDIIVPDMFEELNIADKKEEAIAWAEEFFPQYSKNHNLVAQLYYSREGKELPSFEKPITIEELKKRFKDFHPKTNPVTGKETRMAATLQVLVVGPLPPRKYFGCPRCFKLVSKDIGICSDPEKKHPDEEIEGEELIFQNWKVGDSTDELVITFFPGTAYEIPELLLHTITIRGSVNPRDGSFGVWEVINKKAPKTGLKSLKKTESKVETAKSVAKVVKKKEPEPEPEVTATPSDDEIFAEKTEEPKATAALDFTNLERSFKKTLQERASVKPVSRVNIVNWLSVQAPFRLMKDVDERTAAINEFLTKMQSFYTVIKKDDGEYIQKKG